MGGVTLEQLPVESTMKDRTYVRRRGLGHLKMRVEPYPVVEQTGNEGKGGSMCLGIKRAQLRRAFRSLRETEG